VIEEALRRELARRQNPVEWQADHDLAFGQVEHWLSSPRAMTLHESPTHLRTPRSLVVDGRAIGGALHDARIAALSCRFVARANCVAVAPA
jgi:hypothetical protein